MDTFNEILHPSALNMTPLESLLILKLLDLQAPKIALK